MNSVLSAFHPHDPGMIYTLELHNSKYTLRRHIYNSSTHYRDTIYSSLEVALHNVPQYVDNLMCMGVPSFKYLSILTFLTHLKSIYCPVVTSFEYMPYMPGLTRSHCPMVTSFKYFNAPNVVALTVPEISSVNYMPYLQYLTCIDCNIPVENLLPLAPRLQWVNDTYIDRDQRGILPYETCNTFGNCAICCNNKQCYTVTTCCRQFGCSTCLNTWYVNNDNCPYCRRSHY